MSTKDLISDKLRAQLPAVFKTLWQHSRKFERKYGMPAKHCLRIYVQKKYIPELIGMNKHCPEFEVIAPPIVMQIMDEFIASKDPTRN